FPSTNSPHSPPLFSSTHPATPHLYPLSLHDALPISASTSITPGSPPAGGRSRRCRSCPASYSSTGARSPTSRCRRAPIPRATRRSEEHTSELQSRSDLVCRLLLEKKKKKK